MLRLLSTGVTGLRANQAALDVIGNNVANINTTGFKASRTAFSDLLSQTLSGEQAATDTTGGRDALQIGLGTSVGSVRTTFTQGAITVQGTLVDPNASPTIIEDNTIISARTTNAASTAAGWMFANGISLGDANGVTRTHVVRRNHVSDVYSGLTTSTNVDARDNWFTGGVYAFRQLASRTVTFTRNDVVGLLGSFTAPTTGGNYQCNWWGLNTGPTAPSANIASSMFTPWAAGPIAGTSVACP